MSGSKQKEISDSEDHYAGPEEEAPREFWTPGTIVLVACTLTLIIIFYFMFKL